MRRSHWPLWKGRGSQGMRTGCWDCCHCEGLKSHLERGSRSQALPPRRLSSSQGSAVGGPHVSPGSVSPGPPQPPAGCDPGCRSPATTRTSLSCLSLCVSPDPHRGLSEPPGESCGPLECWGRGEVRTGGLKSSQATQEDECCYREREV